jgi:hypothetical protein
MPRFKVAHVKQSGIDMIIIPVDSSFGGKTPRDQQGIMNDLQRHAQSAGLAGAVVPVWEEAVGQMGFRAPTAWHPFFMSINLQWVWSNINRELFW